jgi:hypothetical protein
MRSWLSWLAQLIKRFLPQEKEKRTLIARSPNKRAFLYYEVRLYPWAFCSFYLVNPTDSQAELELHFDDLSKLHQEFKRQKLKRSIGTRDTPIERQLGQSLNEGCNYRLTVNRTWKAKNNTKEQPVKKLAYIIDFQWGIDNKYDNPYGRFKRFAISLLNEELPSHYSDWGKYLCDPHAIDWLTRLETITNTKNTKMIFP